MPSMRRIRLLAVASIVAVALVLFYTTSIHPSSSSSSSSSASSTIGDFYHKTKGAIDRSKTRSQIVIDAQTGAKAGQIPADRDADGNVDADDEHSGRRMMERLQASEQQAKKQANEKGGLKPDAPSVVVGVGSAADGQKKAGAGDAPFPIKEKGKGKGKGKGRLRQKEGDLKAEEGEEDDEDDENDGEDKTKEKSSEEREAEREMNAILKKSPVIIFSKTYCPHSKRAKGLLLEKYAIMPEPYVVELDEHPLGPALQDLLEAKTGRRTVPNIMVNGVSVGGADQLVQLDGDGELVAKISDLGQKRVEILERFSARDPK